MAQNFSIISLKKRKVVHLELSGDFDGSSALDFIYYMADIAFDINGIVCNNI